MTSSEHLEAKEVGSCLLCATRGKILYGGQHDRFFSSPGTWQLLQCGSCGLVWINPRPLPSEVGKLYDNYYTHDTAPRTARSQRGLWGVLSNAILEGRYGYPARAANSVTAKTGKLISLVGPLRELAELSVMALHGPAGGTLLDVGCGNGEFLARMRNLGWEVAGIEPDIAAAEVARQYFGLHVKVGMVGDAEFSDESFDAITLSHVVEHLLDPVRTLEECRRLLKPGGRLVVVTPNVGSLGHQHFRAFWRGLEVPRHIFLFTPYALRICAESAGFSGVTTKTSSRSAHKTYACSYLNRRNGELPGGTATNLGASLRARSFLFHAKEYCLSLFKEMGEEIVLIATRDGTVG